MPPAVRLVAVLGSATPPGRLRHALIEALDRAASEDRLSAELIDLAERRIGPAGRPPETPSDDTPATVEAIAGANAIVLATPVYRGSLTGVLKNLLDLVPLEALRNKPVAIVAMGASAHHYLGAERHLRDVLAWFGALTLPTACYLESADFEDGAPNARAAGELDAAIAALCTLANAALGPLGPAPLSARARR